MKNDSLPLSLFHLLQAEFGTLLTPLRCSKATLVHLSHTLEDMVLSDRIPAMLFTGFQESSHWREETERYRALANVAQQVCIFAGGELPPESVESQLHVTLKGDDPLRQEWFLLLLCPQFSVLLCGQDRQVSAKEEAMRQFDTLWSFAPAVITRVVDLLERVIGEYRPERLAALQEARKQYPPVSPDAALVTRLTSEMIRYEEELHRQLVVTTDALNAQLRWRDDLLAVLVHDLRTPLQSVMTALQMLDLPANSDNEDIRRIAFRGAEQLENEIQLVLDTSKIEAGQFRIRWRQLQGMAFLEAAVLSLRPLAQSYQVTMDVKSALMEDLFWGDGEVLQRVLQNLVGNALKFTPQGGRIEVLLQPAPQQGRVELRVRDTGTGISSNKLKHIFERYYQVEEGDRRGTGLGLYFCRLAVEAHGGTIRAESQLGNGTAMMVTLPLRPPPAVLMRS
jgi:signal transduction histidine kinase